MSIALTRNSATGWRGSLVTPNEKVVWQQMAQHWLRMISNAEPPKSDQQRSVQTKAEN